MESCAVFCGVKCLVRLFSAEFVQQISAQSIKASFKRSTPIASLQPTGSYIPFAAYVPSIRMLSRRVAPKIHPHMPCQMLVGYCHIATLRVIQLERFAFVLVFLSIERNSETNQRHSQQSEEISHASILSCLSDKNRSESSSPARVLETWAAAERGTTDEGLTAKQEIKAIQDAMIRNDTEFFVPYGGEALAMKRAAALMKMPAAKLTEGVSIDDYSTWRAVRFADRDETG